MEQPTIIDRGRGPEIAGTRILVLDVYEYTSNGWDDATVAVTLGLSSAQVRVARRYIDEHPDEVEAEARAAREFAARGNSPEVRALLDAAAAKLRAWRAAHPPR